VPHAQNLACLFIGGGFWGNKKSPAVILSSAGVLQYSLSPLKELNGGCKEIKREPLNIFALCPYILIISIYFYYVKFLWGVGSLL